MKGFRQYKRKAFTLYKVARTNKIQLLPRNEMYDRCIKDVTLYGKGSFRKRKKDIRRYYRQNGYAAVFLSDDMYERALESLIN
jgi:hypothetical protein